MATFSAYRWYYIYNVEEKSNSQNLAIGTLDFGSVIIGQPTESDPTLWWQLVPSQIWTPTNLIYLLRNHASGPDRYMTTFCADGSPECSFTSPVTAMRQVPSDGADQDSTQWLIRATNPDTASWASGTYQMYNEGNGTDWRLTCDNKQIQLTNTTTDSGIYWTLLPVGVAITDPNFLDLPACADPSSPSYLHCALSTGPSQTTKGLIAFAVILCLLLATVCTLFYLYRRRKRDQFAEMRRSGQFVRGSQDLSGHYMFAEDSGLQLAEHCPSKSSDTEARYVPRRPVAHESPSHSFFPPLLTHHAESRLNNNRMSYGHHSRENSSPVVELASPLTPPQLPSPSAPIRTVTVQRRKVPDASPCIEQNGAMTI